MSTAASRIGRVRVRAPAGTAAADVSARVRLGLTQWLSQAEAACHAMSPDAIVVVRQVRAPWQALRQADTARNAAHAEASASMHNTLRSAQHGLPGTGATVGAGCPAVWFNNEAEVLAGLAQDALGGVLAQRWWWPSLLGQPVRDDVVQGQWVNAPKHVPQALAIMQTEQQGAQDTAWLRHMGAAAREALLHALSSAFPCDASVLSWVRQGDQGAPGDGDGALRLSRLCAVLRQRPHDAADGRTFLAKHAAATGRPQSGDMGLASDATEACGHRHRVGQTALVDAHPSHAPHPPNPPNTWPGAQPTGGAEVRSCSNTARAPHPAGHAARAPAIPHPDTPGSAADHPSADGSTHATPPLHAQGARASSQRAAASDEHGSNAGSQASASASMSPDASALGAQAGHKADLADLADLTGLTGPQGSATQAAKGPQAAQATQPPPATDAFTHPHQGTASASASGTPASTISPTSTSTSVPVQEHPLATQGHTGSHASPTHCGLNGNPPSGLATGTVSAPAARLDTPHAGLFFLLNAAVALGWYGDFTQPQHRGLGVSPWQFLRAAGAALAGPTWHQDPLANWLLAMDPTPMPHAVTRALWAPLRTRLALALGLPRLQATRLTLNVPGQVRLRTGRLDVHMPLAQLPLAVRMAGLDRDIGWLPAAGLDIRFHFEAASA